MIVHYIQVGLSEAHNLGWRKKKAHMMYGTMFFYHNNSGSTAIMMFYFKQPNFPRLHHSRLIMAAPQTLPIC